MIAAVALVVCYTPAIMIRVLIVCVLSVVLAGCSARSRDMARITPTGSAIDAAYDAPRERVWPAVTGVLAAQGVEVTKAVFDLGVIVTDYVYATGDDDQACTGVSTGEGRWISAVRYRLHLDVVASQPRVTLIRVYADVQVQESSTGGEGAWIDCSSTGAVERSFLDRVSARLGN